MRKIEYNTALVILTMIFVSCKTHQTISVMVIDKLSKQPIDSVSVVVTDGKKSNGGDSRSNSVSGYTDSNGKFKASLQIGYAFGTSTIHLEYAKKGYVYKVELNKTDGVVELVH